MAGWLGIDELWQVRGFMLVSGFGIAVVFAVPDAILAELVDLDERTTGKRREAMYFGAQGLFVKLSWGGAAAIVALSNYAFDQGLMAVRADWIIASVGATGNLMLAAVGERGTTRIQNAACEPELPALGDCLNAMGARVEGAGTPEITIEVEKRI